MNEFDFEHRLLLNSFAALLKGGKGEFRLHGETLLLDGATVTDGFGMLNPRQFHSRAKYLAGNLGLGAADWAALAMVWHRELAVGEAVASRRLIEIGQSASSLPDTGEDELAHWRRAMLGRLREAIPDALIDETGVEFAPVDAPPFRLDFDDLLKLWPQSLLDAPLWSQAEAPLPGLEPLRLDDTWVDVGFIEPDELGLGEDFLASMEHRYEERRWRAESADLLIERLGPSTALIGAPGIGKTTFLKWLARRLLRRHEGRFLLPLWVSLRRYVLDREHEGDGDLMDHALRQAGIRNAGQRTEWANVLAYLSGHDLRTVLLLLDGWDEVPAERRESLAREIENLGQRCAFVITSRPSGFPRALRIGRFHEITELSPDSIDRLVRRWFAAVSQPLQADALLSHLDRHGDLYRLARNPFLLTLLCGIAHRQNRQAALPCGRGELYRLALEQIRLHHSQRYPDAPFDTRRERQAEDLAWWLMHDAPGAPRYVFSHMDAFDSCHDGTLLRDILLPSRLLSQWDSHTENLHFIHTTFQEYLAARTLLRLDGQQMPSFVENHANDAAWQEVLRFVAAGSERSNRAFWVAMARLANSPDRFGMIHARIARFLAETDATDGGMALLGFDIREVLWLCLLKGIETEHFAAAYAELDPDGYVNRVWRFVGLPSGDQKDRTDSRLIRTLQHVRGARFAQMLVDRILGGDSNSSSVAAFAARDVLDTVGRNILRQAAGDMRKGASVRSQAIKALGYARDHLSVDMLLRISEGEHELRTEALRALAHIGGEAPAKALGDRLDRAGSAEEASELIDALGRFREPVARDRLMHALAYDPQPELIPEILEALAETPISRYAELILEFLEHDAPDIRRAAAWVLAEASEAGVAEALAQAAQADPDPKVRIAAIGALRKQARPIDAHWLAVKVRDATCDHVERANALEALLLLPSRFPREVGWLLPLAAELAKDALSTPRRDLSHTAATGAHLLGCALADRLTQVCNDPGFGADVREAACNSLGKIKAKAAIPALQVLLRQAPNALDDEDEPETEVPSRLARAAASALAKIDPKTLLDEPGIAAESALARYAVENGALVFKHYIQSAKSRGWLDPAVGMAHSVIEVTVHPQALALPAPDEPPFRLCCICAHDEKAFRQLERQLASLRRNRPSFEVVDLRNYPKAGDDISSATEELLEGASLIIFLLSPDFMADPYCYQLLKQVKDYRFRGRIPALALLCSPTYLSEFGLGGIEVIPPGGGAIRSEEDWVGVVNRIKDIVEGAIQSDAFVVDH